MTNKKLLNFPHPHNPIHTHTHTHTHTNIKLVETRNLMQSS